MTKLWTIVRREVQSAFASPVACVTMFAFALVAGLMLVIPVAVYQLYTQTVLAQSFGQPNLDELLAQINVVEIVFMPFFGNSMFLMLFVAPALTMRLLADEKRGGTDELILTAPLTVNQIVVGKYLAGLILTLAVVATTVPTVALLFWLGTPPIKIVLSSYLGLALVCAALVAVGLLTSSLTESQIVAAVLAFAANIGLIIISWAGEWIGSESLLGGLLSHISLSSHFEGFVKGVIQTDHVAYFVSLSFLAVFLTSRVVESHRWR